MISKQWLYLQLNVRADKGTGLSPINRIIATCIILAATVSIVETEDSITSKIPDLFFAINIFFGILFTIEYMIRLWCVGEDPRYQGLFGRLKYITSPFALIDLLALIPFYLSVGLQDAYLLRIVRLFRLVSLARFGRYSDALKNIALAIKIRRYELVLSLVAAFVVMIFSASALHFVEAQHNPESFGSIPRALWWGVATVTKVGYGGALPVTLMGKVFSAVFSIAAVGVVALPTGILAASFGDAFRREKRDLSSANSQRDSDE